MEKEKLQHYSIRKLSVGAASVLIGLSFVGLGHATQVKADTVSGSQQQVVETSKPEDESTEKAASPDDNQVNNQSLNDDQGQAQAANVTENQKSVRGGSKQLNASSETQNETPDNNNSKAATALRTSENEEKVVENNKNKVETTTLNLNQKVDPQTEKANLAESKVQVTNQSSSDLATTTDPSKLSAKDFASGTKWTSAGWTRSNAQHVAKESKFTYDNPNAEKFDLIGGQSVDQSTAAIEATIDKNDIVKGNQILLAAINSTKGNGQQDQHFDLWDTGYITTGYSKVKFQDQYIGDIDPVIVDQNEVDYVLVVNNTVKFATDPKIEFKINTPTTQLVVPEVTNTSVGNAGIDYAAVSSDIGSTYYIVNNSQIIPVKITATPETPGDLLPNTNHLAGLYDDPQAGVSGFYAGAVYSSNSDKEDIKGVQKVSTINAKLDPSSSIDVYVRTKYYVVYNNKMYGASLLPANVLHNCNAYVSQAIKTVKLANNLSANDVLAQTPSNTVSASYQNDGSYIVAYNISPDTLATGGENYVKTIAPYGYATNIQLKDNKQDVIEQTVNYYQQRNWVPSQTDIFLYLNTNQVKDKPDIETVTDLTPNSSFTAPTTVNSVVNGASLDGELYKHASVSYVDDDNNNAVISKDSIIGRKNEGTVYTVNIPSNYKLADDNTDSINYKWSADKKIVTYTFADDQKQNDSNPIVIHLTHGRKELVDSNVISETVHYQFEDGSKAADDYNAKHVVSSRIGHKDLVTGETIWDSDWSKETFPEVNTPHINGYTADLAKIDAQNVDGTSQDIVKTVVYKANDQKIFVHYIDDDVNGQDLHTDPLVGKSNTVANYTTGDAIKGYENQGYDLVSDDTHGQAIRYDADDDHDQNYSVHLKHHISTVTDPKLLTATFDRTVTEKFPDSQTKTLTQHYVINRTGTQDQVTKKYTFANWSSVQVHEDKGDKLNGYTAVIAGQNPSEIASIQDGTPVVKAEVFTNSNDAIQPVNANETVVITYNANDQKIYVHYIDDDEAGKDLHTDSLVGKTNTDANYTTGDAIKGYLDQGYDLVSDDTKGAELKYDADDAHDQIYNVHFKHHISAVTDPKLLMATFNRTVNEKLPDGQTKTLTQHYVINRTGTQDQVTKKYTFGNWSTAQVHEDKGDNLDGYTAVITNQNPGNIASIQDGTPVVKAEVFTNANDNSIQPVNANELVEIAYNANDQKATITFIDDDAQKDKQVLQTKNLVGKSNTKADYDTGADIENYLNKGFELVSDDTQGKPITFDAHDKVDQSFEVHFKHHISDVTDPRILNATFDRVITEHTPDGKDKQFKQHYVITRTGTQDQVTKQYKFSDWTVANVHEDKLDNFRGYTAHINSAKPEDFITVVDGVPTVAKAEQFTNENGKLLPKNVSELADISYTANPQSAAIVYIDDTADKVLSKVMTTGHYGETIEFTPNVSSIIDDLVKKGYVLVSNDFDGQKYDADNNQNIFDVHLKHGTLDVIRSKDVTETIHYVYDNNSKAHDDYVATKKFENHGVKDLVTGNTTWDAKWTPENDQFAQVNSPEIPGYTADKTSVPAQTVNADSKNLEYTVTYTQIPAPTPYEPSDPVQPAQPSTPVVPDQPNVSDTDQQSVDNNAPKKAKHHNKSRDLNNDFNDDYGNTVNKSSDYTGIKTVKITQNGKPTRVIKINQIKSETVDPVKSTVHVKSQLPKTGSDKDQALVALGLASASLSGLFGLGLRKKKEEN